MLAALLISLSGEVAEASLWPGLASKVSEKSGAFRTDDFHQGSITLRSPYLVTHLNNADFAGHVNAAIARERIGSPMNWQRRIRSNPRKGG